MSENLFAHAQRCEHERLIDCYPCYDRFDDEDYFEDDEEDNICHNGYPIDEAFGSMDEVNRMFI